MDSVLASIAGEIVKKNLGGTNKAQIISELKSFLIKNGGDDLLVDDDLSTLFELCCIFSDVNSDETMVRVNNALVEIEIPTYNRIGKILRPKEIKSDQKSLLKFADTVCGLHLDLHYQFKDKGICFLDNTNVVFSFENIRQIENIPYEFSGMIILNRIKNKQQLNKNVDQRYISSKQWHFLGKHNRCQGKYFTTTEALDLISDRKIISFDNYA